MLGSRHIINPNRALNAASAAISLYYPIALQVEDFLDLFVDVKSFRGGGFAFFGGIGASPSEGTSSEFFGFSRRVVEVIGKLGLTGEEINIRSIPSALIDYPVHSIYGGTASFRIDFGRSLCLGALICPYIDIRFSNGFGSTESGPIVGGVDFDKYGVIPIRASPSAADFSLRNAGGRISISERYSSLRPSQRFARPGERIKFIATQPLKHLSDYDTAFFGTESTSASATEEHIIVTVPRYAQSGPVRFTSTEPQFDTFLSYDEITIYRL